MPRTVRPKILVVVGAVTVSLAAAATALAGNGGFAPVAPVSPNAHAIKQSYLFISIFTIAIFLLVETLLIVFVIRYRRRKRPRDADGAQVHGANRLELAWTVGPVLILFVIAAFVFVKLPTIQDVPAVGCRIAEPRRRRDRHPVHVAVPLPERRRRRSTSCVRRRDGRSSSTSPRPTGTSSTPGGSRRSAGRWTRSRDG